MTVVPFVVESYEGIGPSAGKLLRKLAARSGEREAQAWLAAAYVRISVALQRGNALAMQTDLQQLRLEQHPRTADLPLDSQRTYLLASVASTKDRSDSASMSSRTAGSDSNSDAGSDSSEAGTETETETEEEGDTGTVGRECEAARDASMRTFSRSMSRSQTAARLNLNEDAVVQRMQRLRV